MITNEYTLKEYTRDEQIADMRKKLEEKGLRGAVEDYCDKINAVASLLSYLSHREIQEYLCDIVDLIKLDEEVKKERKKKLK